MEAIIARQVQGEKKQKPENESYIDKLDSSRYFWTHSLEGHQETQRQHVQEKKDKHQYVEKRIITISGS